MLPIDLQTLSSIEIWPMLKTFVLDQLKTNDFFSAGLLLSFAAGLLYSLKRFPLIIWAKIRRECVYTVFFDQQSDFYRYFNDWFEQSKYKHKIRNVHLTVKTDTPEPETAINSVTKGSDCDYDPDIIDDVKYVREKMTPIYSHKSDYFFLWYKNRFIRVSKDQEKREYAQEMHAILYNSYSISGVFSKKQIHLFIENVLNFANKQKDEQYKANKKIPKFSLYLQTPVNTGWNYVNSSSGRSFKSIIMDKEVKKDLIFDLKRFVSVKEKNWYFNKGLPYKRGYLFHGSPGSGKSSLIRAIASTIGYNVYFLSLTKPSLNDNDLITLFSETGNKSLMVLEDIDSVFKGRKNISKSSITFSGLLNCLDGVLSQDSMIIIFTTNHLEKLDDALIRAGRIDKTIKLCWPHFEQIEEYYELFFNRKLNYKLPGIKNISMAMVQEICITNKDDPENAQKELLEKIKINNYELLGVKQPKATVLVS